MSLKLKQQLKLTKMPYNIEENEIRTKLFGVTIKADEIGRQQLLLMMRNNPKALEKIEVFGTHCYITYEGKTYTLGRIKEEYGSLLNSHETEVISYQVTGGYDIEKNGNLETSNLGINIVIKLHKITSKNVKEEKKSLNWLADETNQKPGKQSFAI